MTTATKLAYLGDTKAAIRNAIVARGVSVPVETTFRDYAIKIENISGGGDFTIPMDELTYTRPADWLALPSIVPTDQKFVALYAIYERSNFVGIQASGNYTIDWGDGNILNYNSGVIAYHEYDYTTYDIAGTTLCSRGYKQAIIQVYPQAGQNLTGVVLNIVHATLASSSCVGGYLDIAVAGSSLSTITLSGTSMYPRQLERVSVYSSALVTCNSMFRYCSALRSIPVLSIPTTISDFAYMFNNCYALLHIPSIDTSAGTNFGFMFSNCSSLKTIPAINTSNGTSFSNMFGSCTNLEKIPSLDTSSALDCSNLFMYCTSLLESPVLDLSVCTYAIQLFYGCTSLKRVSIVNMNGITNLSYLFANCTSLVSITGLNTNLATSLNNCFSGCRALQIIPSINTHNCTNFVGLFGGCYSLLEAPLLDTSNGVTFDQMFFDCINLQSIPAIDTSKCTSCNYIFYQCNALLHVPMLDMSLCTSFNNMFGACSSLREIPAINLNAATEMTSMFIGCTQLTSIKLINIPLSINVVGNKLSAAALNELYSNLKTVAGYTIYVSGNYGTAGDDITIATAKGWAVSG